MNEKLSDAQHLLHCLEKGCEACRPEDGVKYESNADDYLISMIATPPMMALNQLMKVKAMTKIKMPRFDTQQSTPKPLSPRSVIVARSRPLQGRKIDKGPFKYYIIMFLTFLGPPTHIFDDLQYCKSSKIAIF